MLCALFKSLQNNLKVQTKYSLQYHNFLYMVFFNMKPEFIPNLTQQKQEQKTIQKASHPDLRSILI